MDNQTRNLLMEWADTYNDPLYFQQDPIAFPRRFLQNGASLPDIEIAAVFAAHFAWGRRAMIVRDCERLFDEMNWQPYDYVMQGVWRDDAVSIHRMVKWQDIARICEALRKHYSACSSLEALDAAAIREKVYGQKPDKNAANKKINMMRRWMVRDDGRVDLGVWTSTSKKDLLIPLDVHVHRQASELGLTTRSQKDLKTAVQITSAFSEIFPEDPAKGDFALFGYGVTHQ